MEEYKRRLKTQFDEGLETLTTAEIISDREKYCILHVLKDILTGGDGNINRKRYAGHPGKISEDIDIEGLKKSVATVSINSESEYLTPNIKSDLRGTFLEGIDEEIDTLAREFEPEVITTIESQMKSEILPPKPYGNCSVRKLNEALEDLSKISSDDEFRDQFAKHHSELYGILPEHVREDVREEMTSSIPSWQQKLQDAHVDASKDLYESNLKSISKTSDPLGKIVALKQLLRVINGERSRWPDLVASENVVSPTECELSDHRSDIEDSASEVLEYETEAYIKILSKDLTEALEEYKRQDDLRPDTCEKLIDKIKGDNLTISKEEAPFVDRIENLRAQLGHFGQSDDTYQKIREELKESVVTFEHDINDSEYESMQQGGLPSLVVSIWSDNKNIIVPVTVLVIGVIAAIILTLGIGGLFGGTSPNNQPSTGPSEETELVFESFSWIGNYSNNSDDSYTLQYSVIGGNPDHQESHEMRVGGVRNVSIVDIKGKNGHGATLTVENINKTIRNQNRKLIRYDIGSDTNTTSKNTTVTIDFEAIQANSTSSTPSEIAISVTNRSGSTVGDRTQLP
jgi:hypothetical protein